MPSDAPTAFFSYSREDSQFALRLAEDLKAAGAVVWIDQLDIEPGKEWDNAIEDAVTQCPRMLLILTAASVKSKKVRNEIAFALDEGKTIIPVLRQDCMVPLQLRRIQHIDFRTDYARGLKALLKTLGVEQQAAAEKARLEQEERERLAAAEQARVEEERRQAAEQARVEEERKQAAAEKARLEQEEHERLAAAEGARLEQEERERLEQERSAVPAPAIVSPTLKKIVLAVCGILVVALILYWAMRPKQQQVATQPPAVQTQPSSPPPSAEVSSGSAATDKAAADKAVADKVAADKVAADKAAADKAAADKAAARKAAADKAAADKAAARKAAADKAAADKMAADKAASMKQQATEALSAQEMLEKGGDYYRSGDNNQALAWYRKAAEAGDSKGMYCMGWMYENGNGVQKDLQQAIAWYRKAAKLGDQEAKDRLMRLGVSP